ncbi:MAG: PEP-utilizing enzyme [Anaerolineales bacterium]|jgi:pyruvate,water dikinase
MSGNLQGITSSDDEWNATLQGDYLWSNVNFGEAVTKAMTPLAWSVLQFSLDDWVFIPGYPTVGNIGGIPYLNISVFASLFHALGRNRQDLLNTMEATLYMHLPEELEIAWIPLPPKKLLSSLYHSMQINIKQKRGIGKLTAYLETNPDWFQKTQKRIRAVENKSELIKLWQDEMGPHIKRGVWCVLGSATHSADYTIQLRRDLTDLVGPDDANILIANVSEGRGPLASLGPLVGLEKVARGAMSKSAYLQQHGHRGPHEFEISVPRPAEDPEWLESEIANYYANPVDVTAIRTKQEGQFHAAWERLQSRYPGNASTLSKRIAESARRVRLRENARSEYVRDRWAVRLFALRAAELTGLGEDIFFLSLDEVLALLAGDETGVQAIHTRREKYQKYKPLPPYPSVIQGRFHPFEWAADPQRRSDIFIESITRSQLVHKTELGIINGSPGSAGQVEGVVRLLDTASGGSQFQKGEILVAVQTDIAWTMIFPRAAGIITDVGAPLSHAAIVARELGIPAVVGCGDASIRLKTGDRVRVDGSRGQVEILDRGN